MRIVFAGGGTGGHLFPGIALAQRLLKNRSGAAYFLCTERPFDAQQLSAYGLPHAPLASPRLRDRGFARRMASAVGASATCLRVFRPDVVVGLGGYGSAPAILAALAYRIPVALLEQNVLPGKANRIAARAAGRIYAQWEEARPHFRGAGSRFRATGSPLREQVRPIARDEARRLLGLDARKPVVAVIGGSQGAEPLNRMVLREIEELHGTAGKVQFLHIAGPEAAAVESRYRALGLDATVRPFIREMEQVYSAADLVVSRAGAMAIAELARFGAAAVLVPYARAADDHQAENARVLSREGAAWMVDERESFPGAIGSLVASLVSGGGDLDNRRRLIGRFARPDAAEAILGDLTAWV